MLPKAAQCGRQDARGGLISRMHREDLVSLLPGKDRVVVEQFAGVLQCRLQVGSRSVLVFVQMDLTSLENADVLSHSEWFLATKRKFFQAVNVKLQLSEPPIWLALFLQGYINPDEIHAGPDGHKSGTTYMGIMEVQPGSDNTSIKVPAFLKPHQSTFSRVQSRYTP